MANDNRRDMHAFFMPKANAGHSAETGFDVNDKRRKRQRTRSPDQDPAVLDPLETHEWVDQLNAAASGALLGSNATYRSTGDQGESSVGRTAWNRTGSNGSNLSVRGKSQNGCSTDSSCPINADMPLAEEISQPSGADSNEDTAKTPPKKMLRVRPDGKLGSPKAKAPAQDAKPKRGRKSAKAETLPKMLVASVRYGTDAQSRSSTGRKIANIFSSTAINPSPAKSKPNRPPEPPKPTHPFFLGGPKRDRCQQELAQSNDDKETRVGGRPVTPIRKVVSPTKARVTSKPPGISESSAAVLNLGGNAFRSDQARISRFPGAMEPLWPPEGMVHVRQDYDSAEMSRPTPHFSHASKARRKMKEAEVRIPKEERILTPYIDVVQAYRSNDEVFRRVHSREWRDFRRPLRRIVTGRELQQAVRREVASKLPMSYQDATDRQNENELGNLQMPQSPLHPAVHRMYKNIATSLTAFDMFECETQDWVHKYAPDCAEQVLQPGREVLILRDWLKTLTINSVAFRAGDSSKPRDSSVSSRRATTKRKRRRAGELDGFVLSSDEEANEMCEVTDSEDGQTPGSMLRRSIIRSRDAGNSGNGERVTNAVVISGPHGCGKTAAVHAVARELGFEVFEINAGSRRSGRDIWDKVGDMTRNHLVNHAHPDKGADAKEEAETMNLSSEKLKQDLDSGRQGTVNSFFKSKRAPKKSSSKSKPKVQELSPKKDPPQRDQSQKQSLILLEEVDVLFDEDKTFWATTLELLVQSKRPVIMTCTDESLLPLEDMVLYAILRLTPAPEQLATDYLLLVACNEGHILPRDAVLKLYKSKGSDLRASMTELNFFCQMAIGDTKGGLEWMLDKSPSTNSNDRSQEPLRVVSEGTYQTGMGWLSGEHQKSLAEQSMDQEAEMLSQTWYGWYIDVGACDSYVLPLATQEEPLRTPAFQQLSVLDQVAESFSAADTFPGRIPLIADMAPLDTAQPELTEKVCSNFVEGLSLLQADPVIDQTGVAQAIAFTIKACARRLMHPCDEEPVETSISNDKVIYMITEGMQARRSERLNVRFDYAAVFEPIARSNKIVFGIPKGPQISTFDGSLSTITEDLAPYVRSIVHYDLRLEEQRRLLSSLLSQPGKNGKRQRTTRASRAALEGGSKAHTRRERWFPKNTNFDLVLQSGGEGWQDIALKQAMAERSEEETGLDEGSSRDSTGSAMESDA
ncbi:hypothetical protein HO173_003626 [Letharia columbiana]|uniref:AAA+ ATPase domain-containing protein n=1 Tax=Letharia columbiana TaxID=112416 RepID=A0A8H6G0N8_9LECA|nr:uncharacterized protein HO173_003626 [Letharia columbiana]KAF6238346.1 hypothetical protein HO173_003626 [Letharia columbiana]